MSTVHRVCAIGLIALLATSGTALARADGANALRTGAGTVTVSWHDAKAVDVYLADKADATIDTARLLAANDRDSHETVAVDGAARRYYLLRDRADGSVVEVAERLIPFEQGSNFRDIGGYAAADGRHVRWGLIYRSGATPLLSPNDQAEIHALGLRNMLDLRSDEERQIAPTKIDGVQYRAVGYSMLAMMKPGQPMRNGVDLYRDFPEFLAPQMRILFTMLERDEGPVVYNCSAGQDRTGFATALILSALGVPRETIIKDYLLSTGLRRPQWEMPKIDPALYKGNPVAQMFAHYQDAGAASKPQPLVEADGTPFLMGALEVIDTKWGSVDNYLKQEIGVSDQDIAELKHRYLQ